MTIDTGTRQFPQRSKSGAIGPVLVFAITVAVTLTALLVANTTLSKDLALATAGSVFFGFAALVALIAWCAPPPSKHALSYWDVAGALTLFGICAGTMLDSGELVQLIESRAPAKQ